jgi:hypothetical protein
MCWVLRVKNNLIASDTGYIWPSACLQLSREPPPSLESQRFPTILARAPLFQHPPASAFSSLPTLCDLLLWRAKFWLAPPRIDFAPATLCVCSPCSRGAWHLCVCACTPIPIHVHPLIPYYIYFVWRKARARSPVVFTFHLIREEKENKCPSSVGLLLPALADLTPKPTP